MRPREWQPDDRDGEKNRRDDVLHCQPPALRARTRRNARAASSASPHR
jgi:hypothetical protein